jgi:hypothetical protein
VASADSAESVEQIPDEDQVSRAYFELPEVLAPESYFSFTYDKDRDERAESVYWRKYAPLIADVHDRACRLEKKWSYLDPEAPAPLYVGARTAEVWKIRSIVTQRGHSFMVIHRPQDNDRAHAHISIQRAGGNVKKLSKNDRMELAALIIHCFEDYQPHECQH